MMIFLGQEVCVSVRLTILKWIRFSTWRLERWRRENLFPFNLKTCRYLTWILDLKSQAPGDLLHSSSGSGKHISGFLWSWQLSKYTVPATRMVADNIKKEKKNSKPISLWLQGWKQCCCSFLSLSSTRVKDNTHLKLVPEITSNLMFSTDR